MSVNIEQLVNSVDILGSDTISTCDDKLRTITAENTAWLNTQLNSAMTQLLTQFRADTSLTYSASEVDTKLNIYTPIGSIIATAQDTNTLDGYLYCNGQVINRTTYSGLFSKISTVYGAGNGSTTFNIPDFRGVFLRGLDDGRGLDTDRAYGLPYEKIMGSYQGDALKSHNHTGIILGRAGDNTGSASSSRIGKANNTGENYGSYSTPFTGETETRPKNIAIKYFIKY